MSVTFLKNDADGMRLIQSEFFIPEKQGLPR